MAGDPTWQDEVVNELRYVADAIKDLEQAVHDEAEKTRKAIEENTRTVEQVGLDLSR